MDEKKYAIYSRKSKYTGKGESTANQIEICINTLKNKFGYLKMEDILVYEDEGFSGYNTNRPNFKRLIEDIKNKKIKVLLFYKLDRISRNVADFTRLLSILEENEVVFLSATENIETLTPSGKALTYMISVFAELERNTIAERIKDNMFELAKTGVWLGGNPPTGYKSVEKCDSNKKKKYHLEKTEEIGKVLLIFNTYLKYKSLTKLETYLLNKRVYSCNLNPFTRFSLKNILSNPVYVKNDEEILKYYQDKGAHIYGACFDGKSGLMVYNKTRNINHKLLKRNDISDWIIAVGEHEGIIDGKTFITVQNILESNNDMRYRRINEQSNILSGLIKCPCCKTNMRPKIRRNKNNFVITDFICELKEKSKRKLCQAKNIRGDLIEEYVVNHLLSLPIDMNDLLKVLKKEIQARKDEEIDGIHNKIKKNEKLINSLIEKIKYVDLSIVENINLEIRHLKEENDALLQKIAGLDMKKRDLRNIAIQCLDNYKNFYFLDTKMQKNYLHMLVESIVQDGKEIIIIYK